MKIKFVVGNANTFCSKVWTVKIHRDDIYIMCGSGKYHKVSLHGSGVCHSALTSDQAKNFSMPFEKRTNVRWTASPNENECMVAFTALISYDQLDDKSEDMSAASNLLRIPTPPICSAVVVYFVKANVGEKEVEYQLEDGIHLLQSVKLKSGIVFSILYSYTTAFNSLIQAANTKFLELKEKLQRTTDKQLTSGFTVVSDNKNQMYYIELKG